MKKIIDDKLYGTEHEYVGTYIYFCKVSGHNPRQ